jgi:geranylgeranyl reductase family protein
VAAVDLLVVGAGPGGSNAAAVALEGGLQVVQLDARPFPRTKPCAGGLTRRAVRALRCRLDPAEVREHAEFEFNSWKRGRRHFSHRSKILSMVVRPDFDAEFVRHNLERPGLSFHGGERVLDVRHDGALFHARTERGEFSARQLVAADGANGIVNRRFGVARPRSRAVAIEVDLAGGLALPPCFDFGFVERGYGWVFPKQNRSSVGLYTLARGLADLRGELVRYARAKGFRFDERELRFEAHTIPLGGFRLRVPEFPLYVVGDAGGFADALTGEGIYHALESGRLAGETAVDVARGRAGHRRYYRRLWRRVLPDALVSFAAARAFYRWPGPALACLRLPFVWRPLVEGFARGATLCECLAFAPLFLARSYLGRTAALRSEP